MKSTENKNRKPKTSNLPLSMGAGFYLFGSGFVWVVLAFLFCYDLLRGILSCLLSLVVLIGFFSFLFSQIF